MNQGFAFLGLCLFVLVGARSRDRTGTALRPLVFETSASTYSAIRALSQMGNKCSVFFLLRQYLLSK